MSLEDRARRGRRRLSWDGGYGSVGHTERRDDSPDAPPVERLSHVDWPCTSGDIDEAHDDESSLLLPPTSAPSRSAPSSWSTRTRRRTRRVLRGGMGVFRKGLAELRRDVDEIRAGFHGVMFPQADPDCQPVPTVDVSKALIKLEVMDSWDVDACVLALYVAIAVGFAYTVLYVSVMRNDWHTALFSTPSRYLMIAINFCTFLLAVIYIRRIVTLSPRERTDEQLWTCVLVASGLAGRSPFTLYTGYVHGHDDFAQMNRNFELMVVIDALYTLCTYFYLICSAHAYRLLGTWDMQRLRFYSPKVALVVAYVATRLTLELYSRVHLGFVPMTRLADFWFFFNTIENSRRSRLVFGVVTAMDFSSVLWFLREVHITRVYLSRVNYLENRFKQLGFRFFLCTSLCFLAAIFFSDIYLLQGTPKRVVRALLEQLNYTELSPVIGELGLSLMYFTWLALTAYANYPAARRRFVSASASSMSESSANVQPLEGSAAAARGSDGMSLSTSLLGAAAAAAGGGGGAAAARKPSHGPLLYRHREKRPARRRSPERQQRRALGTLFYHNNVFVMETQLQMMNCAWLSYIPMNEWEERPAPLLFSDDGAADVGAAEIGAADVEPEQEKNVHLVDMHEISKAHGLQIVKHIYNDTHDGHCVVLEGDKRVIVSFCGTRQHSMRNWKTNFQIGLVRWEECFPPAEGGNFRTSVSPMLEESSARNLLSRVADEVKTLGDVKVHRGFAEMYSHMRMELLSLLSELFLDDPDRMLYFTGHSLGGAMSMLASYDCIQQLDALHLRSARQIQVMSFGMPKVGNYAWKLSYEATDLRHWRTVLASDVITKMPQNWSYRHAGVKVLLDWNGNMLVDPSLVEVAWWHTTSSSAWLHTRPSYMLALMAFCQRYRDRRGQPDDLRDKFWPWPIRPEATRHFSGAEQLLAQLKVCAESGGQAPKPSPVTGEHAADDSV